MTLIRVRDWLTDSTVIMIPRYWALVLAYLVLSATLLLAKGYIK